MICSGCSVFGVTRNTASSPGCASSCRVVGVQVRRRRAWPAPSRARRPIGLHAATSSAPGTRSARFSAWRRPMPPAARRCRRAPDRRSSPTLPSQLDDALLAPRGRRGLGELERLHAVVDRRARSACRSRARRRSAPSRARTPRDSARGRSARACPRLTRCRGRRDDLGRPVVARLQHALAAEHLEALVVAVGGAADRVDLRQAARRACGSSPRSRRRRRRSPTAGIGEAAAGRVDASPPRRRGSSGRCRSRGSACP